MANETYPVKGQIISMELGNYAAVGIKNQYRVLKANGSKVKVVALYEYNNSTPFNSKTLRTSIGTLTVQKYNGSDLDTLLNTTFYNSLLDEAKEALVEEENVTQDVWYWGTSGNPVYSGYYGKTNPGTDAYSVSLYSNSGTAYTEDCGNRYVYALSVQDVIDYVTDTTVGDGQLQNYNIWKMLWNSDSQPDLITYPWLRSGFAGYSEYAWRLGGEDGFVTYGFHDYEGRAARPVFTIDLSKLSEIEWSIVE